MTETIRFKDGAAYERYMGRWSQLAGRTFLDWLQPPTGRRWLDIGCGNGAFTELIVERTAPAAVTGIDPSPEQLTFARRQAPLRQAEFHEGDAMALPFADAAFDVAVMPLVIFFVPEPPRGVAEMVRVVAPGGLVSAYAWDMPGGGFPYHALFTAIRESGMTVPETPHPDVSRMDELRTLWTSAGLTEIATHEITVERRYAGFDEYWEVVLGGASVGGKLRALSAADRTALQARLRAMLPIAPDGSITYTARANAVRGRVPPRASGPARPTGPRRHFDIEPASPEGP